MIFLILRHKIKLSISDCPKNQLLFLEKLSIQSFHRLPNCFLLLQIETKVFYFNYPLCKLHLIVEFLSLLQTLTINLYSLYKLFPLIILLNSYHNNNLYLNYLASQNMHLIVKIYYYSHYFIYEHYQISFIIYYIFVSLNQSYFIILEFTFSFCSL